MTTREAYIFGWVFGRLNPEGDTTLAAMRPYSANAQAISADGHVEHEQETKYPGTDRHKAIADFESMKKQRPGIEAVKDIAKGKWER